MGPVSIYRVGAVGADPSVMTLWRTSFRFPLLTCSRSMVLKVLSGTGRFCAPARSVRLVTRWCGAAGVVLCATCSRRRAVSGEGVPCD